MSNIKEYALHSIVWLRRFRHRRGWGIHSPFAYRFVHEVVFPNGHFEEYRTLSGMRRSKGVTTWARYDRLFFRLARFAKPDNVVVFGRNAGIVASYISSGYKPKAVLSETTDVRKALEAMRIMPSVDMVYVNDYDEAETIYNAAMTRASEKMVIVIRGINKTEGMKSLWGRIEADERAVQTFDLYYLGIVMFRGGMSKEAFKVCF